MNMTLSIPDYNPSEGIRVSWVGDHQIKVIISDNEVTIIANKDGFLTLATQMLTLAQEGIPSGHGLTIQKK
jgi:hypothetical protein